MARVRCGPAAAGQSNRIFAKTGSRDRAQAVRYAYSRGYADPASP